MKTLVAVAALALGLPATAACGPASSEQVEARPGSVAIAERLPRTSYQGGPFLRHPHITTVTFAGEDLARAAELERFGDVITRGEWWRAVTLDHCASGDDCVGKGAAGDHVRLEASLPATVSDLDVERALIAVGESGRLGKLDPQTLIAAYLPEGVQLHDAYHAHYCDGGPRAYHRSLLIGGVKVAYAVMPRCGDLDQITATASHEILDSSTSPDPNRPGFTMTREATSGGFTYFGGEPMDPCGLATGDRNRTTESGYTVMTAWSNSAAELGRNPCVPADDEPFVALVPEVPSIRVAEPRQVAVPVTARSDRRTGSWAVAARDLTGEPCLDAALDRTTVSAGASAVVTLTIHRVTSARQCLVGLVSTINGRTHVWPLLVSQR